MGNKKEKERIQLTALAISQLNQGKTVKICAAGSSMFPILHKGDLLSIHKRPLDTMEAGDLVAFKRNNGLIVHRVVKVIHDNGETLLRSKGDSVFHFDENIDHSNYAGKVISLERNDKKTFLNRGSHLKKGRRIAKFNYWYTPYFWMMKLLMIKSFSAE